MINVVIVDDRQFFLDMISLYVKDKVVVKNLKYRIHCFKSYNVDFWKLINSKLENLILFLDIEVPPHNGIDVARKIRHIDANAEIVFITANDTEINRFIVSSSSIKSFGFINKANMQIDVYNKLDEFINLLEKKNTIKLKENNSLLSINLVDIIYLTFDSNIRKTVIYTTNDKVESYKSLSYYERLLNELSNNFVRTHKSCIVNVKKVKKFDFKNEEVIFKDNKKINLLSQKYKKEIEYKFNLD